MCLGIPGQITQIVSEQDCTAMVLISGVKREVNLGCVLPDSGDIASLIGKWTLVHVGFAMSIIDEVEAQQTLKILADIGELQEELEAIEKSSIDEGA